MSDKIGPVRISDDRQEDATEIRRIVHGQVVFNAPSLALFGVGTATAALAGMTPDMRVLAGLVMSGASAGYGIIAAQCLSANIVELTVANMHSATNDPSGVSANIFAYR